MQPPTPLPCSPGAARAGATARPPAKRTPPRTTYTVRFIFMLIIPLLGVELRAASVSLLAPHDSKGPCTACEDHGVASRQFREQSGSALWPKRAIFAPPLSLRPFARGGYFRCQVRPE